MYSSNVEFPKWMHVIIGAFMLFIASTSLLTPEQYSGWKHITGKACNISMSFHPSSTIKYTADKKEFVKYYAWQKGDYFTEGGDVALLVSPTDPSSWRFAPNWTKGWVFWLMGFGFFIPVFRKTKPRIVLN